MRFLGPKSFLALGAVAGSIGCASHDGVSTTAPGTASADASVAPLAAPDESAEARVLVRGLAAGFTIAPRRDLGPSRSRRAPEPVAFLGASEATRLVREGRSLRPEIDPVRLAHARHRAQVTLPLRGSDPFTVVDADSDLRVQASLVGAADIEATQADGYAVYRGILGKGVTLVHRPTAEGTEDFVEVPDPSAASELRYQVELGDNVAGLRLVSNTLELLDAGGAPRLRIAAPTLVDAAGTPRDASLELAGCAYDSDPRGPWDRPVTSPGSRVCSVRVSWDAEGLAYPILVDPAWTTTGSMTTLRGMLSVNSCTGGKLVAAGGYSNQPNKSADLFDPSTSTWSATGAPLIGRYQHKGLSLADGRVLITGGTSATTTLATAEVYNPSTGLWTAAGSMSAGRIYHPMTLLANNKAAVIGGWSPGGYLATVDVYDPAGNSWSQLTPLPFQIAYHFTTLLTSGAVLVGGGTGSQATQAQSWLYDPSSGTTTASGMMAHDRMSCSANRLPNGAVLVAGGDSGAEGYTDAELYDPSSGKWTLADSLGFPVLSPTATNMGAFVVLAGGVYRYWDDAYEDWTEVPNSATAVYVPSTAKWVSGGYLNVPRANAAAALATSGVVIAGGYAGAAYLSSSELYQGIGLPCSASSDCPNGYCIDGYCCDGACGNGSPNDCLACNVPGLLGTCAAAPNTTVCRPAAGTCDQAEKCTGITSACPTDTFLPANTVCRAVANECDSAEVCTGSAAACPADTGKGVSNPCTDDGNVCTTDLCGMSGGAPACLHAAGNPGMKCRPQTNECDVGELCTGTSTACPADVVQPAGTACTDDGIPCSADLCNGVVGAAACTHPAGNAGAPCRAAAGVCDAVEKCDGLSTACPTDVKLTSSTVCRAAADVCDLADSCDGVHDNCPADTLRAASYQCRAPSCTGSTATLAANCTGSSTACPAVQTQSCSPSTCSGSQCGGCTSDAMCSGTQYCSGGVCTTKKTNGNPCSGANECGSAFCADGVCCNTACSAGACDSCALTGTVGTCSPMPSSTVCRAAAGECDVAETCTGSSTACPSDGKKAANATCTDDGNVCTRDVCDGSGTACTHPAGNAGTLCRALNGSACDLNDYCDGTSTVCADAKVPAGSPCRAAAGECDVAESCDGTNDACPADAKKANNTACTDDGNVCTIDVCNGSSATCQHPAGNAGAVCRASGGPCDVADTCNGTTSACTDAKQPTSYVCRAAGGECDLAETCDGATNACPADVKRPNGAGCTDDGNVCTTDTCNGSAATCQHPPGFAGTVCRAAAGSCDVADTCDGVTSSCPDAKQPVNTVCRPAADVCDVAEKCDGASNVCPADAFLSSSTSCRAASCTGSTATLAASCSGSAAACPAVQTQSCSPGLCSGTSCGGCTSDAQCTGAQFCSGGVCVTKKANGQSCGGVNECTSTFCADGVCCNAACTGGVCDSCALTGTVGVCTATDPATVCRPATGECDVAETCGGATTCPADANKNGQACSSDGNVCTTDVCQGATCAHAAAPASTVCRAAVGECDLAETCGGATTCPADTLKTDGTACSSDSNACTSDICQAGACAHPAGNAGTVCRAATGECDVDEKCDGTATACPTDGFLADSTPCSGDGNVCTADVCKTGACTHPAGNAGTVCRAAVGECDVDEACNGTSVSCPNDAYKPNGALCTDDALPCTFDQCQGGLCTHPAGNAGTVCRAAATECDVDEKCDGVAAACPTNAFKADGTACTDDGVFCTLDKCVGGSCAHPSNDGASCSDGDPCSSPDVCTAGHCVGTPIAGCTCTTDAQCDDANACNGVEKCVSGSCKPGAALDCNDKNDCTTDGCSNSSGCTHVALADGATCDDGKYCTVNDSCASGACTGKARDCSGIGTGACQTGACDETGGACIAANAANGTTCDDGDSCTLLDKCTSGTCAGQPKVGCKECATVADCDDSNPCTTDLCDDVSKQCAYLAISGCSFDAGVPDAEVDAPEDAAGDSAGGSGGAAGSAGSGGAGGSAGSAGSGGAVDAGQDAQTDAAGGSAGSGGVAVEDGGTEAAATFDQQEFPACACSVPGRERSSRGAFALVPAAAFAAAVWMRRRGRARASAPRRALTGALTGLVLVLAASAGHAADPDKVAEGKRAFSAGVALLQDPDGAKYEEAQSQFKRAWDLVGSWKVLGNLALCQLKLQRDGEAIETYEKYLSLGGAEIDPDERAQVGRDLLALKAQVVHASFELPDPGMTLVDERIDSRGVRVRNEYVAAGKALELGLHPGRHMLSTVGGRPTAAWESVMAAGGQASHKFEAEAKAALSAGAAPVGSPPPAEKAAAQGSPSWMKWGGYAGLGVAAVGTTLGVVFAVQSHGKRTEANDLCPGGKCPIDQRDQIDSLQSKSGSLGQLSAVSFIAAGVGAATGVTLLVLNKPTRPASGAVSGPSVSAWVGPSSAGLAGAF